MTTRYMLLDKSAKMPSKCKGQYRRLAIVELNPAAIMAARLAGQQITELRIDPRDKRILRIIATWERLNVGITDRCAYGRALADAKAMLARLLESNP